jgi:hypothetical protein
VVSEALCASGPEPSSSLVHPRTFVSAEAQIAYLNARVAALEEAMARRSQEFSGLETLLCRRDQVIVARFFAGLSPLPHQLFEVEGWTETTGLVAADVDLTLKDLWLSVSPPKVAAQRDDHLA